MPSGPRHDVAIYAPGAAPFYDPQALFSDSGEVYGGGGAEFQTSQLAKGLAKRGLRVAHIVGPIGEVANPIPGLDLVQRAPYRGGGGPVAKLREAIAIWRALRAADAQLYILRGQGMHLLLTPVFARLRRRLFVMSASNDFDFTPRLRGAAAGRRGPIGAFLYRRALGAADAVVAQTEQQRRIAARESQRLDRLSVIPSFAEQAEPASGEAKAFLWPGRIVDYKRPLKYVELAEALPEARFWMTCVRTNETPAGLDEEVRQRASRLNNLELLEFRPRAEMLDLIRQAVAIVVTSQHEGMPNAFLEAWMRSIPVLSLGFDPDGLIERQEIGFAAGDDWDRFVSAADKLWRDESLRNSLGEAGCRYVKQTHDAAVVTSRWMATVNSLLA